MAVEALAVRTQWSAMNEKAALHENGVRLERQQKPGGGGSEAAAFVSSLLTQAVLESHSRTRDTPRQAGSLLLQTRFHRRNRVSIEGRRRYKH